MKQLQSVGIVALFFAATLGLTQQPQVANTQFKSEPASSELSATVDRFLQSNGALWVGYEVPLVEGIRFCSCAKSVDPRHVEDGCSGEYQLEQDNRNYCAQGPERFPAASHVYVLLRLDGGKVIKVRTVSAGSRLNAGGVPFQWLTNVPQDESVALLAKLATEHPRMADQALAALSAHATAKATDALAGFAAGTEHPELREKGAFWLGAQRGHDGFTILQRLVRNERDADFRKKLTFDLFINSDSGVADELLRLAKSDSDPGVRSQAIFWLAQKAGKKAAAGIKDALDNDPEIQVKKKAVFALSQLPRDESVPQLIHVARTHASPAIRKEAIFWLGQSNDPRALDFLEEILKR